MKATRTSPSEYARYFPDPSVAYNTVEFSELNKGKCLDVHYLLLTDDGGKVRLGITLGLCEDGLKAPFSAPFGCIEETRPQQISYYLEAVDALRDYGAELQCGIRLTLPPSIYSRNSHIEKQHMAALTRGVTQPYSDCNYVRPLSCGADVLADLSRHARKCYRAAYRSGLSYRVTEALAPVALEEAYSIVRHNHQAHGYPVHMSMEQIEATLRCFGARVRGEVFIVSCGNDNIAASINYIHAGGIVQPVYWGHLVDTGYLRPMNYLAVEMARHYASRGFAWLDQGTSSLHGIPNYGLCRFKESLGYELLTKPTLLI